MSKSRNSSISERGRQRNTSGSASSRKASTSKSSNSTATKSSSPALSRKSKSKAPANTRRRSGLSVPQHPPIPRDQRSPSSASSRGSSAGVPARSIAEQMAVISDMCEISEVDGQPSGERLQEMRDDLYRRRKAHETWRESFAQRSDHLVRALERINARRKEETKILMNATNRKDATTEMDRVVLGSANRWRSRHENGTVNEPFRKINTQ